MAENKHAAEPLRRRLERRKQDLNSMRSPWTDNWSNLATYIAPTRYRASLNAGEGGNLRGKIIDSTASFALRTLKSGMHSGITSPARPWFRLATLDPDLRDYGPVKEYLATVESTMREVFSGSNLYQSMHTGYGDLGLFGQSCGLLVEDKDATIRLMQLLHGSFWLARDHTGIATTLFREFSWSVERIIARFGYDRVSSPIRNAYDRGDYDERFTINHGVYPREQRNPDAIDKRNKPFASVYWEEGGQRAGTEGRDVLEESGFDENPIIAPPWELIAEDHYADSPGAEVLPDVKSLQVLQTRAHEAIDKMVRPPMRGPTSMMGQHASLLPGSITYVDDVSGQGYRAAIEVNLRIAELEGKIGQTQQKIERGFYADLFLMLANMEGIQPRNQFEIAERKEEKLLALGPVLENIYGGQLEPIIDRTFAILSRRGDVLPPAPPELQGRQLKIEYISILAQAQKAVATGALERGLAFVGNLAATKPEVLDKIDADEAVDVYFDMVGGPPSVIVNDDQVKAIREARAQQQQQAMQTEAAATLAPAMRQGAEAARVLSETDSGTAGALLQRLGIGG